jgi:DNA-binding transcriptional LysR family regulator
VDVQLTPAVVDLVREGIDLAVRVVQHRLRGASLVARRVGTVTVQLYASPSYLARRGTPRDPGDLAAHDGIAFRGPAAMQPSAGARARRSAARPRVTCDDMFFAREVVRAGGGVGALPSFIADLDVAAGRLVRVLPRWLVTTGQVYLVRPSRKHVPRAVTAFSDLVLELLHQRPLSAAERDPPA